MIYFLNTTWKQCNKLLCKVNIINYYLRSSKLTKMHLLCLLSNISLNDHGENFVYLIRFCFIYSYIMKRWWPFFWNCSLYITECFSGCMEKWIAEKKIIYMNWYFVFQIQTVISLCIHMYVILILTFIIHFCKCFESHFFYCY